jgi:anti-sigma B factor antagonist
MDYAELGGSVMVSLSTSRDADTVTVVVRGEIDISNAERLTSGVNNAARDDVTTIVVDLTGVTFIDSVGISALLKGRRMADEHGKIFRVSGASGLVRQLLDLTGVWTHLSGQAS